jgi:hypothetical protein
MLHDKYEFLVSVTIVYVNVTLPILKLCEMWMLHAKHEFVVCCVNVYANVKILCEFHKVYVNVTWKIWILCELGNCLCKCYMTNMNYFWEFHNCLCKCYMTNMNSLWASQLFM